MLRSATPLVVLWSLCASCDKSEPLADASSAPAPTASPEAPPPAATSAATTPATTHARVMPPRPVPTSSPTVRVTMPEQVQLEAIQYMSAMQAPQPSDAPADPQYGQQIADALRAVGRTEVVSSGRRVDILLEKGCDATLPREAVARHTSATLTALLAHGVLVVRCADHNLQCLQSTRDGDDVLCTHK